MRPVDQWCEWIHSRRQGGRELEPDQQTELERYRQGVLAGARLKDNDALLDVGCGDGLIGFGALEADVRVHVVFSDVSAQLLGLCEERARQMGVSERCRFVQARAEELTGIDDQSVDVVTTRSVLIYVNDKRQALSEFFRVLRPGGRLSLFEPINRRMLPEPTGCFWGWDVSAVAALAERVSGAFHRAGSPEVKTMVDFDENDLVRLAEASGFEAIDLHLNVSVMPAARRDWDRILNSSPNPLAPTLGEAIAASLDRREATLFQDALRLSVETGRGKHRLAVAYLRAGKT